MKILDDLSVWWFEPIMRITQSGDWGHHQKMFITAKGSFKFQPSRVNLEGQLTWSYEFTFSYKAEPVY